ncbi:MAG: hypothetical protein J5892_01425 [Bacilli bacterium]|nr:hypothetical protein [Bacilli bacterium]
MNQDDYKKYVPSIGDHRYQAFPGKFALDHLRVKYYEQYHKDPSITHLTSDEVAFYDPTLPIFGDCYYIRGPFSFKIYFQIYYQDQLPNNNGSLIIKIAKCDINDDNMMFICELIKYFTGQKVNLIVGNYLDNEYRISFINKKELSYPKINEIGYGGYYNFFDMLCDNCLRNIVYIGDDLKKDHDIEDIINVDNEFILKHQKKICEKLNIPNRELLKTNEAITKKLINSYNKK